MSVLYKALQKAQKENEDRQPSAGGTQTAAPTSAVRLAMPSVNWRMAGLGLALVLAVAIGGAVFLFDTASGPAPQVARPVTAPPAPAMQPPAAQAPAAQAPTAPAPTPETASAAVPAPAQTSPPTTPAEPVVASAEQAEPIEPVADAPKAAAPQAAPARTAPPPPANQPMPQLAADSPARALKPPIAIKRDEYDFSGVGDSVQVRRVSQQAQDNVTAGYNALVRGDHAMALGFYDRALQQEPRSILAQLGRGAAMQKIGNLNEARTSYERVLRIDPNNREALTNLTVILAEREPGEALKRLQELEREYPSFSPVKAQIGLVYAKLNQLEPALDYLRRAVNLTPDAPMYHLNLALVLDRLNRKEQAVVSYERVLAAAAAGRVAPEISVADIERRVRYLRTK
jgi:Tfp pilus assembly protein PilF